MGSSGAVLPIKGSGALLPMYKGRWFWRLRVGGSRLDVEQRGEELLESSHEQRAPGALLANAALVDLLDRALEHAEPAERLGLIRLLRRWGGRGVGGRERVSGSSDGRIGGSRNGAHVRRIGSAGESRVFV